MASQPTENVTWLESERLLCQIWDKLDYYRMRHGETATAKLAQHLLKTIREYEDGNKED